MMKKNFMFNAMCNDCHWQSGYSVKTYVDEEVKRHKESDCLKCSHPADSVVKYVITGEEVCTICALDINTGKPVGE